MRSATLLDCQATLGGRLLRLIVWRLPHFGFRPFLARYAWGGPLHVLGLGPVWIEWGRAAGRPRQLAR